MESARETINNIMIYVLCVPEPNCLIILNIFSICSIREPIADPKTTKYKAVEITGDIIDWRRVRNVRAISNL